MVLSYSLSCPPLPLPPGTEMVSRPPPPRPTPHKFNLRTCICITLQQCHIPLEAPHIPLAPHHAPSGGPSPLFEKYCFRHKVLVTCVVLLGIF